MKFVFILSFVMTLGCHRTSIISDVDGNKYSVKKFGSSLWMLENLSVEHDLHGNKVNYYFPNNDSTNFTAYGLLYDYETACTVCPEGWRLPNNNDWDALFQLNKSNEASTFKDEDLWMHEVNSNRSRFSARPSGIGNNGEHPNQFMLKTLFWSIDKEDDHYICTYILEAGKDSVRIASQHPTYAFSVRCIQDEEK